MKKILISDYDGTLYTDELNLNKNVDMINKFREKGNLFVIATGRPYFRIMHKIKKYKIPFDYLIVGNGSVIFDKNNKIIKSKFINKKTSRKIIKDLKANDKVIEMYSYKTYKKNRFILLNKTTYILVKTNNKKISEEIMKYINNNYEGITTYNSYNDNECSLIDIVSNESEKSNAILDIINIENIDKKYVYVIGDSSNDVKMITNYNGYGMTKSDEKVLKVTNKLYDNVYDLIKEVI